MIFYDRGFFDQGRAFLWSRDTFKDQNQGSLFMVLAGFLNLSLLLKISMALFKIKIFFQDLVWTF